MIKNFTPRLYQETILHTAAQKNTLVVLPTGMGKTNVFLMLASQRFMQYPKSKILMIGPTRPLIDQYFNVFLNHFEIDPKEMAIFTGHVKPEKRAELWKSSKVVFSTPQGLENDIISKRIDLSDVSLLCVDEAHRAVGDYSYVWITKQYHKLAKYPRILALTASPGSDLDKISEVCKNLYIEDVEVRTDDDPDVKPYIKEITIDYMNVEFPEEFKQVRGYLDNCFKSKLQEMKKYGYITNSQINNYSKKDLISLQAGLHGEIARGQKDFGVLKSISLLAEAVKIHHALELIETQGIASLEKYLEKIMSDSRTSKVKAVQNLVKDINFKSAYIKTKNLVESGAEHPKLRELRKVIELETEENPGVKILVFSHFRDSASKIEEELNKLDKVKARMFVGQAKKSGTGLSQKEQIQVLEDFKEGKFNTVVMTSVGEEGLDIPKVDLVVFYEPIPSAIRSIQRRGRTGRQEKGRVIVLVTKGTRDEAYRWSAHHKEKRMHRTLKTLKQRMGSMFYEKKEEGLTKYFPEQDKVNVFVDYREKGSGVIKELIELGANINLEKLESADYILSSRVGVEYKTVEDFVNSLIDGRLLEQIKELKHNFDKPIVLVEGDADIFSVRNVHPNSIRGMLATIAVSYGIPVMFTKNFKETAALLEVIAKREQEEKSRSFSPHGSKKPIGLREQQEYIVSALPGVGPGLTKPLLEKFGSVKGVVNADALELEKVEKIGSKKAGEIKKVVDDEYNSDN